MQASVLKSALLLGLGAFVLGACAGDEGDLDPLSGEAPVPPVLRSVAPSEIAVGDTVTFLGQDFPSVADGKMYVHLEGTYVSTDEESFEISQEFPLLVEGPGIASFVFDRLFFHPTEGAIGTFNGSATLITRYAPKPGEATGSEAESQTLDTSIRILPSIVVDRLRAIDVEKSCEAFTRGTTQNSQFELGFKAIGFGEATPANPWNVSMTYEGDDFKIVYVKEDAVDFGIWWLGGDSGVDDTIATFAPSGQNEISFTMDRGSDVFLNPQAENRMVDVKPEVRINQEDFNTVALGRFAVAPLEEGQQKRDSYIILEINSEDGRTLRRIVSYQTRRRVEIGAWNGVETRVKLHEPERTCGCIPGNDVGRMFTYEEREEKSVSLTAGYRYDINVATNFSATVGLFNPVVQGTAGATWTEAFGVDVNQTISTSNSSGRNISINILPTYYATCYRQLEELQRKVELIINTGCGESGVIGEIFLTNWQWGFDIAQGPSCDPPPESSLSGKELAPTPGDLTPIF